MVDLFRDRRIHIALLVAGLFAVEAFLSMWTGLAYDMQVWFQTGVWMNQGTNIYLPNDHLGYPPLWAFWSLFSYRVYSLFGNNIEIWRLIIKLPLILAQFALAFFVGKFAEKRFDQKTAQKIFLFTLTWIFFIYIGALWGQLNMLSALLTFLAFYAVISKRTLVGGVLLGIAVMLKVYPLIALPAFLAYLAKNRGKGEAGKFALFTCMLPVASTVAVFAVYQWDLLYFLRTIFYWTPVFEPNPTQILGGCMNIWSSASLLNIEISQVPILRYLWIPIVGLATIFWLRKPRMSDADLNLSLISFYFLFMISYAWVTEQMFIDPLPFILLQIFGFRSKRSYLYALVWIQVLIFAFSAFNWGPFIFEPMLKEFSPTLLASIQFLDPSKSPLVWTVRGFLGGAVSVSIAAFLIILAKPTLLQQVREKIAKKFSKVVP